MLLEGCLQFLKVSFPLGIVLGDGDFQTEFPDLVFESPFHICPTERTESISQQTEMRDTAYRVEMSLDRLSEP
jgi:hypothetical protein